MEEHPVCERCNAARSTECHEIWTRARGGPIDDKRNFAALCTACHQYLSLHPKVADEEGWMVHGWNGKEWLSGR